MAESTWTFKLRNLSWLRPCPAPPPLCVQASLGLQPPDKTTKVLLTNDTSIRFFTDNCHHKYCDDTLCWADKEIHETDLTHFRQQILPPPHPYSTLHA